MATHKIEIPSVEALPQAAQKFLEIMDSNTIFAFNGQMGAGKTTFIMALLRALGVEDDLAGSPS
jgi:tRNA threonylcarbamoyladenosine biosynthesis protein TsaE